MRLEGLKQLASERLPGGLGIADARALFAAAGKGAQARRNLEKILVTFDEKFTPKGKAELKKLIGVADEPAPINDRVSAKTKAALLGAYKALGGELGEPVRAISKSAVFAEAVLVKPLPGIIGGSAVTAMIPIGTFKPNGTYLDPNKVDTFYLKRQVACQPPAIYGPFKLDRDASVGQVALHDIDDGRTVRVKKGQDVVVALQSNPSTGYRWHVVSTPRSFGHPAKSEFLPGVTARAIGAPGTELLTWRTAGFQPEAGQSYTVNLAYSRGATGEPARTFTFTVELV